MPAKKKTIQTPRIYDASIQTDAEADLEAFHRSLESMPTKAELRAFETFEQFYAVWLAKYSEHGNYPTRFEAMREAFEAARLNG